MPNSVPALNAHYQKLRGGVTDWFEVLTLELQSTANRDSQLFENKGGVGLLVYVLADNEAGTCAFTPSLYTTDPNGSAVILWTAASAISADGTYIYLLHPSNPSGMGAGVTETAGVAIPAKWYIHLEYSGTPASDKMDTEVHVAYV